MHVLSQELVLSVLHLQQLLRGAQNGNDWAGSDLQVPGHLQLEVAQLLVATGERNISSSPEVMVSKNSNRLLKLYRAQKKQVC